jgi:NAD(P)-dependent dehydrogenase (short-subunit alcohol dehydrogenase family)
VKRLAGKVALITGGGLGLGRGMAERFCAEGAAVAILEIRPEPTYAFEEAMRATGAHAAGIVGDVRNVDDVRGAVARCLSEWGRLDVLVNNAGVSSGKNADLVDVDLDDWHRVMNVNLTGPLHCIQHAAPAIRASGGGSIINITSISARTCYPQHGAYSVSKAALESLTLQAAVELAKWKIRVNAMSLGWFRTSLNEHTYQVPEELARRNLTVPIGRIGSAEDAADLAVFLAGDESTYLTGESIELDGGLIAAVLKSTGTLARIRPAQADG